MGKIYKNGIEYGGGGGSGTGGHTIVDTDGNPVADEPKLQFTGLDVQDNSTDSETEVAAFGLNTDSLDDVMSAGAAGNQVASNGLVYSTTEQVVGKWIDGRPIYQKTIQSTVPEYTETDNAEMAILIPTGISIRDLISFKAVYQNSGGGTAQLPNFWVDEGVLKFIRSALYTNIYAPHPNSIFLGINQNNLRNSPIYFTIQYTKTTD